MFSLIITIIAIALVAALALATIYYGGSAFNRGAASANASKLLNQSQQILGADRLYRADHEGAMPPSMQALVDGGYLKSIPTAYLNNKFTAVAAAPSEWTMVTTPSGRAYQYSSSAVDVESCKTVNQMSFNQDGVLTNIFSGFKTQCYTSGTNAYTVLVLSDATVFTTGATVADIPGAPQYVAGATPSASDWSIAPTTSSAGNTGGSSGGSTGGGATTPPQTIARLQLPVGASSVNWADYLYSDDNFTAKTSSDFGSGLMVARLLGADGQCGNIVSYTNGVFVADYQTGTMNSCFVANATPGDYTMQVIDGSYQYYYIPVTVVSNK